MEATKFLIAVQPSTNESVLRNEEELKRTFNELGCNPVECLQYVWMISSNASASDVMKQIEHHLDGSERLLVIPIVTELAWFGAFPEDALSAMNAAMPARGISSDLK